MKPSRPFPTVLVACLAFVFFFAASPVGVAAKQIEQQPDLGISNPPQRLSGHGALQSFALTSPAQPKIHDLDPNKHKHSTCHDVRKTKDQCAFVHKHCGDDGIGLFDYLDLYYCRLGNVRGVAVAVMAIWLAVLFSTIGIAASDFFCVNLSTIASILGMSESLTGVTFLAFGNGSPDVFSTYAAMKVNSGSLAIGELVGAASFITAVVAGSMAIVRPFKVGKKSFVRDILFFAGAVTFGLGFLADGQIQTWECCIMIGFYLFYVCFVVGWHWMAQRKKRKRQAERRIREHHTAPEEEEDLLVDEDDEDGGVGGSETDHLLNGSVDFGALERGRNQDDEDEEELEQREFAELRNDMRVRPGLDRKKTPKTPHAIRPSLVGALEFRAVLNSLEKNKNLQGRQIHLRRYSDDGLSSERTISEPDPVDGPSGLAVERHTPQSLLGPGSHTGRHRGLSVNDAAHITVDPNYFPVLGVPDLLISDQSDISDDDDQSLQHRPIVRPIARPLQVSTLTLPQPGSPNGRANNGSGTVSPTSPLSPLPKTLPRLLISDSDAESLADSTQRAASPVSLRLPRASIDSNTTIPSVSPADGWKKFKHWPYAMLPPPQLILDTLFPTMRGFGDKSFLEKVAAVIAVPSVFCLTITLPVVEGPNKPSEKSNARVHNDLPPESPVSYISSGTPTPLIEPMNPSSDSDSDSDSSSPTWNRWLVAIQCLAAPVFICLIISPTLKPLLCSLIVGLSCLAVLVLTTSSHPPPKGRYILCFAGFIVSISWISTIAEEVVGVLKALGIIFHISDAILGLTVFAVGNSLGDLVADITVARLGFPVMALSACFGGPMLNILLGIGISGVVMTIRNKKPYQIEVSSTLVISAGTLLTTLMVLLVWVPRNGWRMDRKIGWTLVGIWGVSTVVNVIVGVLGIGD